MGAGGGHVPALTAPHSLTCACDPCLDRRIAMVRNLLAPYEQRPWAQTNWILVRLWKVSGLEGAGLCRNKGALHTDLHRPCLQGCGFGYRYTRLPHLLKIKPEDANLPSLQSEYPAGRWWPCPLLPVQTFPSFQPQVPICPCQGAVRLAPVPVVPWGLLWVTAKRDRSSQVLPDLLVPARVLLPFSATCLDA